MKDLAGLEISQDQFAELRLYCRGDPDFPADWDAWFSLMKLAADQREALGIPASEPLEIEPARFKAWCGRVDVVPCIDALRAYAIIHRAPKAGSQYGATPLDSRPGNLET